MTKEEFTALTKEKELLGWVFWCKDNAYTASSYTPGKTEEEFKIGLSIIGRYGYEEINITNFEKFNYKTTGMMDAIIYTAMMQMKYTIRNTIGAM
jgi:hypothetical protein